MTRYTFLIDTYRTERLKTLSVWSQVPDGRMDDRLEPRARSPREHMVHQCLSEDAWMRSMFGITVAGSPLPVEETRQAFLEHYARVSQERLSQLETKDDRWFETDVPFFDAVRAKGLPVAYVTFAGEQHGFRKAETIVRSLEAELYFYGAVFGFAVADPIEAVAIDNLKS